LRPAVIATGALAVITAVPVDQYGQAGVSDLLSNELRRAITEKADAALRCQPAPSSTAITPPAGLLNQDHETGGTVEDDLDAVPRPARVRGIPDADSTPAQDRCSVRSPQRWISKVNSWPQMLMRSPSARVALGRIRWRCTFTPLTEPKSVITKLPPVSVITA
jgi:hypothetical protein